MSKPTVEGHIHGVPVIIVRERDEQKTRALREFVPLDAYQIERPPVHEYEVGALFEDGEVSRRVVVRRMDRRAVFTDEQLVEQLGAEAAAAYLAKERRQKLTRRHGILRARRRMSVIPLEHLATCQACNLVGPMVADGARGYICSRCNTILNLAGDCPEMLRKLADYAQSRLPRKPTPSPA